MLFSVLIIALKVLLLPSARAAEVRSSCLELVVFEEMENPVSPKLLKTRGVINFVEKIPIKVLVKFEIPVYVSKPYEGYLTPADTMDEIGKKTSPGKPYSAKYYLYFEKGLPLPTVTHVQVNDKVLCTGIPVTSSNKTNISRSYSLVWTKVNDVIITSGSSIENPINPENNTEKGTPIHELSFLDSDMYPVEQYHHNPFLNLSKKLKEGTDPTHYFHNFTTDPVRHYYSNPFLYPSDNPTPRPTPRPTLMGTHTPVMSGHSNPPLCQDNNSKLCCGISNKVSRLIVSGMEADRDDFGWMVPLYMLKDPPNNIYAFICTSTLISENYILTAAHCVKHKRSVVDETLYLAPVGMLQLDNWSDPEIQKRRIALIYVHPDYDGYPDADIALLKLNRRVIFGRSVVPACIWGEEEALQGVVGRESVVFGWGSDQTGNPTKVPNLAIMPIVSQNQCLVSNRGFQFKISNRTFCAGKRDGSGPCRGDSGGGLLIIKRYWDGTQRWTLRGLVSSSLPSSDELKCNLLNYIIFTDVAKFRKWISIYVEIN